jgi:1-aminocyclopropane-1-carboxylate deaminase
VRQEASEPEGLLLQQARALGREIVCLGRDPYRRRHEQRFHGELRDRFGPFHLIPEGGTNALGIQGIAELIQELPEASDVICCPSGTGRTAIGLLKGLQATQRTSELLVFSTLPPAGYAEATLRSLAQGHEVAWSGVRVVEDYSFGGFAKMRIDASMFAANFRRSFGFDLDPVYNVKMV